MRPADGKAAGRCIEGPLTEPVAKVPPGFSRLRALPPLGPGTRAAGERVGILAFVAGAGTTCGARFNQAGCGVHRTGLATMCEAGSPVPPGYRGPTRGNPRMQLEIVAEREGTAAVLRLLGTLDTSTVDQLRSQIIMLLEQEASAIALDMAQLTFVDSSGLGALIGGKKRALEKGRDYFLLDCPPPLQRLVELVGLDQVIDFCTRRELAVRFPAPAAPRPEPERRPRP